MSLYIRTETHIFESKKVKIKGNYAQIWKTIDGQRKCEEYKIIKESDNLEDLCDEFILFDNENKIHYQSQEGSIWWLGAGLYPESVRGAIFTDEGIKYVVKYNKETEKLELI